MAPDESISTSFVYHDESGNALFQIERIESEDGKRHVARQPDGSLGYGTKRRIFYHLPEVTTAMEIVIVEGEKKADALARTTGRTVTTMPGGATGYKHVELKPILRNG